MTVGLLSFVLQRPSSGGSNQRLNINVANEGTHYLNIAKQFVWNVDPSNMNADGYPAALPTNSWSCGMGLTAAAITVAGHGVGQRLEAASMQLSSGPPLIVLSGGTYFGLGGSTGDIQGNATITSQANPAVVFQFGWNIQSISQGASNGLGGNMIRNQRSYKTGWIASVRDHRWYGWFRYPAQPLTPGPTALGLLPSSLMGQTPFSILLEPHGLTINPGPPVRRSFLVKPPSIF